jgi:cytochrome c
MPDARKLRTTLLASLLAATAAVAVGGAATLADAADGGGEAQAARGAQLYAQHCAKCHGDAGQGTAKAPPVVGKAALPLDPPAGARVRKSQFHTAADVAAFVTTKMPAMKPGSLSADEYWAILAFDLKANGVDVSKSKIDATSAAAIRLH